MKLLRILLRFCLVLVALVAGCSNAVGRFVYGPPPPTMDTDVEIIDFSYEPSQGLHVGDEIVFKATLNRHINEFDHGYISVRYDHEVFNPFIYNGSWLLDDGVPPDQAAGDGIYTYGTTLLNPCESIPVSALYFDLERFADPLTVQPAEEE